MSGKDKLRLFHQCADYDKNDEGMNFHSTEKLISFMACLAKNSISFSEFFRS